MPSTIDPICDVIWKCNASAYGQDWLICNGTVGRKPCPGDSEGIATWECSTNGVFVGDKPDVSDCKSNWVAELERQIDNGGPISHSDAQKYMDQIASGLIEPDNNENPPSYFGNDISDIFEVGAKIIRLSPDTPEFSVETLAGRMISLSNTIVTRTQYWEELTPSDRGTTGAVFVNSIEEIMTKVTSPAGKEKTFAERGFQTISKNRRNPGNHLRFPDSGDSFIELSGEWPQTARVVQPAQYVGLKLDTPYVSTIFSPVLHGSAIDNKRTKIINGEMISLSFSSTTPPANFPDGTGPRITFHHQVKAWGSGSGTPLKVRRNLFEGETPKAVLGSATCVFWNPPSNSWSGNGCKTVSNERMESVCECNHLTSFAVLMDVHDYVGKETGLEVLTYILSPLSMLALILCMVSFILVKKRHPVYTTKMHLCGCLLVANFFVLLFLDKQYIYLSDEACTTFGILTHYVFLSAFAWMAIEGNVLFGMVTLSSAGKAHWTLHIMFAYGISFIIVAITAGIGFGTGDQPYGGDAYCWLEGNYIWGFLGPVAVVILVNLGILIMSLLKSYKLQGNFRSPLKSNSAKFHIKIALALTSILGLTWIAGFLMLVENYTVANIAAYFFTLLNASQGIFIFVSHCVLNTSVRQELKKKLFRGSSGGSNFAQNENETQHSEESYGEVPYSTYSANLPRVRIPGNYYATEDA